MVLLWVNLGPLLSTSCFHPLLFYCILPHVSKFPGNNIAHCRDGCTGLLSRLGNGLLSLLISARGDIRGGKKKLHDALLTGILKIEDKKRMRKKLQKELRGASATVSASSWLRVSKHIGNGTSRVLHFYQS